jgi:serine/threonine protein kinase
MICNACGNQLPDGSAFCLYCGRSAISTHSDTRVAQKTGEDHTESREVLLAGKYRLEDIIGRGGMAHVCRAFDTSLERYVAIKILSPELMSNTEYVKRFLDEARKTAKMRHPHIVPIHEAGHFENIYYIAMSLIEGRSLAERLKEGSMKEEDVVRISAGVALALDHAHAHGIVHRDVKPGNILLDADGEPLLTDFGIAREVNVESLGLTGTGVVIGTPLFMSPDQVMGEYVGPLSDLYSLGVVMYMMLAGEPPFPGPAHCAMHAHVYDPPPPITDKAPGVSSELATVIHKLLAKKPEDRFQSGKELAEKLRSMQTAGSAAYHTTPAESGRHESVAIHSGDVPLSAAEPDATEPDATGPNPQKLRTSATRRPFLFITAALVLCVLALLLVPRLLDRKTGGLTQVIKLINEGELEKATQALENSPRKNTPDGEELYLLITQKWLERCAIAPATNRPFALKKAEALAREINAHPDTKTCESRIYSDAAAAYTIRNFATARRYLEAIRGRTAWKHNCDVDWMLALIYTHYKLQQPALNKFQNVLSEIGNGQWNLCNDPEVGGAAQDAIETLQSQLLAKPH